MSAQGLALRARKAAEALMVDACTIQPITGQSTNPTTGVVTFTLGTAVYSGKCKIQNQRLRYPSNPDAGEHTFTTVTTELHLPVAGTAAVAAGHLARITASFDSDNVGRKFRVRSGDRKTFGSALRLLMEEVIA